MDLAISLSGRGDLGAGVYRELRDAIENGVLAPGDRLPSSRELARQLAVARNTVAGAYDALMAEGYAEGRHGAGTFVLAGPGRSPSVAGPRASQKGAAAAEVPIAPSPRFDLRLGTPDPRLFPTAAWRRALADAVDEAVQSAPGYGDPAGDERLRAAIARHIAVSRGVRADGRNVIVTSGAQGAFDLLARTLVRPGDVVAVEDPGYPAARAAFALVGAVVVGTPVDAEGLVVEALPAGARLVATTPAHQMPMGVTLSSRRRAELLAWAEATGATVVEDDYDSEFRYSGRPLEPLQRRDTHGRVVYVGSFSKTLLPMLRLGFVVAPEELLAPLVQARRVAGFHTETATQLAFRRLVEDGAFARHLRRARRVYRARHDRLAAAVARDLGPWLRLNPAAAGLHVAALAVDGIDGDRVERVLDAARSRGVAVESLRAYAVGGEPPAGIAIGFGRIDEAQIDEAVRQLAAAFATV